MRRARSLRCSRWSARAVPGRPRHDHRQRRAAVAAGRPRALVRERSLGDDGVRDRVRRLPARRRPRGRRLGRRRALVVGAALFTAASVACSLAPTGPVLIAARGAQGLGGALLSTAAFGILVAAFQAGASAPARSRRGPRPAPSARSRASLREARSRIFSAGGPSSSQRPFRLRPRRGRTTCPAREPRRAEANRRGRGGAGYRRGRAARIRPRRAARPSGGAGSRWSGSRSQRSPRLPRASGSPRSPSCRRACCAGTRS